MVLYVNGGVQDLAEMHQLYPRAGEWSEAAGLAHQMANRVEWPELLGVEAETARGEYHLHEYFYIVRCPGSQEFVCTQILTNQSS